MYIYIMIYLTIVFLLLKIGLILEANIQHSSCVSIVFLFII